MSTPRCLRLGENSLMMRGQTRSLSRKLNSVCCKQTQMTDALLEEVAELCVRQTDSDDRRALRKLNSVCCKQTQMTDAP